MHPVGLEPATRFSEPSGTRMPASSINRLNALLNPPWLPDFFTYKLWKTGAFGSSLVGRDLK